VTGIKAVDAFHPLGHGQCLALLGKRSAGKSSLVLHVIANQRGLQGDDRVHCVYVAIGQVRLSRERKGLEGGLLVAWWCRGRACEQSLTWSCGSIVYGRRRRPSRGQWPSCRKVGLPPPPGGPLGIPSLDAHDMRALLVDAEGVACAWLVPVCAEGCLDYVTIIAAPVTATSGMRFLVRPPH
jgi:hypothetical protein